MLDHLPGIVGDEDAAVTQLPAQGSHGEPELEAEPAATAKRDPPAAADPRHVAPRGGAVDVIVAPADATVGVVHGFPKWSTPLLNVDTGEQTWPACTNVHGTRAAPAVPANASPTAMTATTMPGG